MTREEAIEFGSMWLEMNEDCKDSNTYAFFQIAIKALEQEPCDDCISRQYLIDKAVSWDKHFADGIRYVALTDILNAPPVTPAEKVGRWTRELIRNEYGGCIGAKMICSECGQDNGYDKRMKFCPNCGAKMEVQDADCD